MKENTGNLFRESLILGGFWEMEHLYLKALTVYRMVTFLKEKTFNNEGIIENFDEDELDIDSNIERCISSLKRIVMIFSG